MFPFIPSSERGVVVVSFGCILSFWTQCCHGILWFCSFFLNVMLSWWLTFPFFPYSECCCHCVLHYHYFLLLNTVLSYVSVLSFSTLCCRGVLRFCFFVPNAVLSWLLIFLLFPSTECCVVSHFHSFLLYVVLSWCLTFPFFPSEHCVVMVSYVSIISFFWTLLSYIFDAFFLNVVLSWVFYASVFSFFWMLCCCCVLRFRSFFLNAVLSCRTFPLFPFSEHCVVLCFFFLHVVLWCLMFPFFPFWTLYFRGVLRFCDFLLSKTVLSSCPSGKRLKSCGSGFITWRPLNTTTWRSSRGRSTRWAAPVTFDPHRGHTPLCFSLVKLIHRLSFRSSGVYYFSITLCWWH